MEKYNCLILEDEPLAAEVLQDYIARVPFLECKTVCRDGIYAMQVLHKEPIDVIFLDIHLPKIKGLDFLKTLKRPPQIIITTAYREYALDGYDHNVVDYLLKPIHFNRFLTAVNKLRPERGPHSSPAFPANQPEEAHHLLINVNKKRIKIYLNDILYVESRKEYISIVTREQAYLTKVAITEMAAQLNGGRFLRVHRSFIVAIDKVIVFTAKSVETQAGIIPVGRSYRELVSQALAPK